MAIPADCIQTLLPDLKSGKLAANWMGYQKALAEQAQTATAPQPKPGPPVMLTVEELKQKQQERRKRFKSLLVDYGTVSDGPPADWRLHFARQFTRDAVLQLTAWATCSSRTAATLRRSSPTL
jgi:hypothetical protein